MKLINILPLFFSILLFSQTKLDEGIFDLSEYPHQFILDKKVNETSGIEYHNGYLYTFNDSGGKPEIYKLSPSDGKIVQTIKIKDAQNKDWEEITIKGDTLFIGDFGNNDGTRKDLTIYAAILPENNNSEQEIEIPIIGKLTFTYDDQINFGSKDRANNFDCEAFVYYNNKLHLFSKRWANQQTTHYELPLDFTNKNILTAKKIETFNTEGLATGASIYNNKLYMVGYTTEGVAYMWTFSNFNNGLFFNGNHDKICIGLIPIISQTEGIAITKDKIYITGEEMNDTFFQTPPRLYVIDKSSLE